MEKIISESLGRDLAVELDPKTGKVTILNERYGVELSAVAVLSLMNFLSQREHKVAWMEAALMRLNEKAGGL